MIWENPWAWAGLAGIALPVLIHLLGRGQARVQRFPTLRFLDASRLLPTRRTRLHDILLLALRVAIVVAGVAAMAQPLWLTSRRSRALGDPLARAIIVDTSASMRRASLTGEPAASVAQGIAARLRDSASTSVVVETANPASAVAGASAWLENQPWRGELDIVSDFQTGAVDSIDLSSIPRRLGIRLARVDVRGDSTVESSIRVGGTNVVARATPRDAGTEVRWTRREPAAAADLNVVKMLASSDARTRVSAAQHAAAMLGVRMPVDTSRSIEILYPGAPNAADVVRAATMPRAPWMTALVARLRSDSVLVDAAMHAEVDGGAAIASRAANAGLVVARTSSGREIVTAVQSSQTGGGLVFISSADAGSLVSAALIAAVTRAQSVAPVSSELEPTVLAADALAAWQRAPAQVDITRANGAEGPSDARALWVLALVLIGAETWVRRRASAAARTTTAVATQNEDRTRVA